MSLLFLLGAACGTAPQSESRRTVAAYEVPLPTAADKAEFLDLLRRAAETNGYHVDAASPSELKTMSEVSPITFSASIWRGDGEESMASAMDFRDRIGRVWLAFPTGNDPDSSTRFRESLVPQIREAWPETASLPIMPSGAIPLTDDLVRTPTGYEVLPTAASKYQSKSD
jgi:hypothetical protein